MLSFNNLWKTLIDKGYKNKTDLVKLAGLNSNIVARLNKNEMVDLKTLIKICDALNCTLNDIVEYTPEPKE